MQAPQLSPILNRFEPSAIAGITAKMARIREKGTPLFDLSTGEPDFETPSHIRAAAVLAIAQGETKYSPTDGTIALRAAVQRKFQRENSLHFDIEQILIASGAKPLLADVLRTIANIGDEVIIPSPCWPSHFGMAELVGAKPVLVPTLVNDNFQICSETLKRKLSRQTRAIILCSPGNPTGTVFGNTALEAIANALRNHPQIWIISDDLYEHITYGSSRIQSILEIAPDLANRTIIINGVSKAYAMTGWRIGYAAGPHSLIAALRKVMSHSAGCPCSISQRAAIAALDGPFDCVRRFTSIYKERRDRSLKAINDVPRLSCHEPDGAFYLFPSAAALIGSKMPNGKVIGSTIDLANFLLEECAVAIVPGVGFKSEPHFRISYATADQVLDEGIARIRDALAQLQIS